ncbi:MAG: tRNA pseudouridine(55) synthase TruB [Alphaproteobacteria bacterium]
MSRARLGRVHGWVVLDKPAGLSSTQAMARARRALGAGRAGHAGTLDPFATGVLPLAFGLATRTIPYVSLEPKVYRFSLAWGVETDTLDATGQMVRQSPVRPSAAAVADALGAFEGEIWQTPPAFSAVHVAGRRAYELARAGQPVALAPRQVTIHRLALCPPAEGMAAGGGDGAAADGTGAVLEVECGSGTYVRALARDLAARLGTVAHVMALRRLAVGRFRAQAAIGLSKLEALGHSAAAREALLPLATALDDIPALAVGPAEAARLRHGGSLDLPLATVAGAAAGSADRTMALAIGQDGAVALVRLEFMADGVRAWPERVFDAAAATTET